MSGKTDNAAWGDQVHGVLKAKGVGLVATVPDAGLTRLLQRCERTPQAIHVRRGERGQVAFEFLRLDRRKSGRGIPVLHHK